MAHQSLAKPIGVIIATLSVIALLLLSPTATPSAAPLQQTCGVNGYGACTLTPTNQTTSTATTGSASATLTSTVAGVTNTPSTTATGATATGATATNAASSTATVRVPTSPPAATLPPPTPINGARACVPGTTVFVEGSGPSYTAILVYFADQAVGGGTTDAEGNFKIGMKIGPEKYGVYEVQARIRSSQRVVAKDICVVPYLSPTPTPMRRSPP